MVKYCDRTCEKAHRPKHEKDCDPADIDMDHIQHDIVADHVASSWKWLKSYPQYNSLFGDSVDYEPMGQPPSQDAKMEAISVFYNVTEKRRISGTLGGNFYEISGVGPFVFHFDDGGELDSRVASQRVETVKIRGKRDKVTRPTKLKCGKHRVLMKIGRDEEIKVVTALWDNSCYNRDYRKLRGLRIETADGSIRQVGTSEYCNEESTRIPDGHALRSIQILPRDPDDQAMFHVETVSLKKDMHVSSVPSLVSLAHNAEVARLKNAASRVEIEANENMKMLQFNRNYSLDNIVKCTRISIQKSPEAAEVRRLQAELNAAQCKLRQHSMDAYSTMTKELSAVNYIHEQYRKAAKDKWKAERANVLTEHDSFLERVFNMCTENAVDKSHSLCRRPECRRTYKKQNKRKHNLCSVDGCNSNSHTCGCSVELCNRCSTFMCSHHMAIHEDICKEEDETLMIKRHGKHRFNCDPNPKEPRLKVASVSCKYDTSTIYR